MTNSLEWSTGVDVAVPMDMVVGSFFPSSPNMNQNGTIRLGMTNPVPDGLSLEYKRDYGTARRNLHLADLVNDPVRQGEVGVSCLGLPKEFFDRLPIEPRAAAQNLPDAIMVGANPHQSLVDRRRS